MSRGVWVHCQSGKPQDRQWRRGEATTQGLRQLFRNHLSAGDGDKTSKSGPLDGDLGCANRVSKLILACVPQETTIEIDVSTAKFGSVVPVFQSPDANFELRITHGTLLSELPLVGHPG